MNGETELTENPEKMDNPDLIEDVPETKQTIFQDLVAGLQGNEQKFTGFIREATPRLKKLAQRFANPDQAEELVQNLFLKIWKDRANFAEKKLSWALFGTILKNDFLDQKRRQTTADRAINTIREHTQNYSITPNPEEKLLLQEEIAAVQRKISELPNSDQRVLIPKLSDGVDDKTISQEKGVSVSFIKGALFRLRRKLNIPVRKVKPREAAKLRDESPDLQ